jgi:hypothetical protein
MKYKILDVRLNNYFRYGIKIIGMLDFHAVRNWFSQTYTLCESLAHGNNINNKHWNFDTGIRLVVQRGRYSCYTQGCGYTVLLPFIKEVL